MSIQDWGWSGFFEAAWNERDRDGCLPARIITEHRGLWNVADDFGEESARASGKLRLAAEEGGDWPATGDWVEVTPGNTAGGVIIQSVLPRRSQFVRKMAGRRIKQQTIAANVDTALLMVGLGGDFNLRRLERYLAQCWESSVKPVVVLNKMDACADRAQRAAEVEKVALGAGVYLVSALTGEGMESLDDLFVARQTIVLLGSSGVGKSTLLNRLLRETIQEIQPVRESDSRGRHTTTARHLFRLPGGALLMDTPGLRELQLWDAGDGISQAFEDIEQLATHCHFRNCTHHGEPGCAVTAAVAEGSLDSARLENQRKLEREQNFLGRKVDAAARQAEKERIKGIMRESRRKYQQRNADGGKR